MTVIVGISGSLRRGSYKTAQDVAVRDFRRQVQEIHEAGDTATARLIAARQTGYDDYVMNEEGLLVDPDKVEEVQKDKSPGTLNADSLRKVIEERERQNERDRQRLKEGTILPDTNSTVYKPVRL